VTDEPRDVEKELALAEAEIATLKMRLKNAELMYLFAAGKQLVPNQAVPQYVERN